MDDKQIYPTSVRLPAQLKTELERLAKEDRRSLSNMILVILERYVKEHNTDN